MRHVINPIPTSTPLANSYANSDTYINPNADATTTLASTSTPTPPAGYSSYYNQKTENIVDIVERPFSKSVNGNVFDLLFPLLAVYNDLRKLIIVSLVPFLFFAALQLRWGLSDNMFLRYYGLFVAGIVAGNADVHNKIRQMNSKRFFVFTIPAFGALLSISLVLAERYFDAIIFIAVLSNLLGVSIVLITLYWAAFYVKASRAKFYAFFTFVAFATYGIYFINIPFFVRVSHTLQFRFNIGGTAATVILIAFIPFVVVAGYLLQFITNKLTNFPRIQTRLVNR